MSRIWIVRHGNTFGPDEMPRRIGARTDLPLVASGREQAIALADWFGRRQISFDRVLSSPLQRTRETAATIAPAADIIFVDWLAEIDHGPDEDQPEAAVIARIGEAALVRWERDGVVPPGWIVDGARRLIGWRSLLAETRDEQDVLLVTSNGAARFALLAHPALAEAATRLPHRKLRTGAFGRLAKKAPGEPWQIEAWDERP